MSLSIKGLIHRSHTITVCRYTSHIHPNFIVDTSHSLVSSLPTCLFLVQLPYSYSTTFVHTPHVSTASIDSLLQQLPFHIKHPQTQGSTPNTSSSCNNCIFTSVHVFTMSHELFKPAKLVFVATVTIPWHAYAGGPPVLY